MSHTHDAYPLFSSIYALSIQTRHETAHCMLFTNLLKGKTLVIKDLEKK